MNDHLNTELPPAVDLELFLNHFCISIYIDQDLKEYTRYSIFDLRDLHINTIINISSGSLIFPNSELFHTELPNSPNKGIVAIRKKPSSDKCVLVDLSYISHDPDNKKVFPSDSPVNIIDNRLVVDKDNSKGESAWITESGFTTRYHLECQYLGHLTPKVSGHDASIYYHLLVAELSEGQMLHLPLKPGHGYYQIRKDDGKLVCKPLPAEMIFGFLSK